LFRHARPIHLVFNILLDRTLGHPTDTFGEVAGCPEAISPKPFLQLRMSLPDSPTAATFERLHGLGNSNGWRKLNEHVDVVGHHGQAYDPPVVHLCAFIKQLLDGSFDIADEDPFAVLRHPHEVILQAIPGVRSVVIFLALLHPWPSMADCFRRGKTLPRLQGALRPPAKAGG